MKTQLKKHTTEQKKGKKKVGGEGGSAGKAEESKPCTQQEGGKEKEGMINPELPGETKKKYSVQVRTCKSRICKGSKSYKVQITKKFQGF